MAEETKDLQAQETQKQEVAQSDAERTRERPAFVPRADIYEGQDEVVVIAEMPGVDADSVDIILERNTLTINGYVQPTKPNRHTLVYAEYREGDYQRSFTLSNEVSRDGIEATMKDGVLHLRLPKVGPKTQKIAVKAG